MGAREGLRLGMVVRSESGQRLGVIAALAVDHFVIGKGVFYPEDHRAGYDRVIGLRAGEALYHAEPAADSFERASERQPDRVGGPTLEMPEDEEERIVGMFLDGGAPR